jgi:hypothetical protein
VGRDDAAGTQRDGAEGEEGGMKDGLIVGCFMVFLIGFIVIMSLVVFT